MSQSTPPTTPEMSSIVHIPALGSMRAPAASDSRASLPTSSIAPIVNTIANAASNGAIVSVTASSQSSESVAERKPYEEPQFSASTASILRRLREPGGLLTNPLTGLSLGTAAGQLRGYEEARKSVLQGMKTANDVELPPTTATTKRNTGVKFPGPSRSVGSPSVMGVGSAQRGQVATAASTQRMELSNSSSQIIVSKPRPITKNSNTKRGQKRKRIKDEDSDSGEESAAMSDLGGDSDSDVSADMTNLPSMTQSGRKVVKPAHFNPSVVEPPPRKKNAIQKPLGKNAEQALCKRCGRGNSPASNMIVFCDGCDTPYHQMCHDPLVSNEVVQDESKSWYCNDCQSKKSKGSTSRTNTPIAASPVPEVNRVAGWNLKSAEEKRVYLSSMPHAHLVTLLLQATIIHPDIPIFPAVASSPQSTQSPLSQQELPTPQQPLYEQSIQPPSLQSVQHLPPRRLNVYPQQPFPPSATSTAGLFSRAEANPSAPINFIRKITASGSAPPTSFATSFDHNVSSLPPMSKTTPTPPASTATSTSRPFKQASSAPPTIPISQRNITPQSPPRQDEDDDSRESTPASPPYPRPGNGLMAKLKPDHEDLEWLVGVGEDSEAFSHTIFDKDGRAVKLKGNGLPESDNV